MAYRLDQLIVKIKHTITIILTSLLILPWVAPIASSSATIAQTLDWQPSQTADNLCRGVFLEPQYIKDHPEVDPHAPVTLTARGPETFKLKGVSIIKDHVVITQPGRILYADKALIFRNHAGKIKRISLIGNVRIYEKDLLFVSDRSLLTLYPRTATITHAAYHYHGGKSSSSILHDQFDAWGTAKKATQDKNKLTILHHATYSTCNPTSPTWQISASTITLNKPKNVGKAYNMVMKFHRLPIFYFPYYTFPLNNARKSGFLAPVFGHISDTGFYFGAPYYFNLAPNYDLLFTPEYYGLRGFRAIAKFRYLTQHSSGYFYGDYLPKDEFFGAFRGNAINTYSNTSIYPRSIYQPYLNALRTESDQRGMINAENHYHYHHHWWVTNNLNWVSDPYYYANMVASAILSAQSTNDQLLNLLQVEYQSTHWDFSALLQAYQTLHLITQIQYQGQTLDQYQRLPDLNLAAYYPLSPAFDFSFDSSYTNFTYFELFSPLFSPVKPIGQRLHLRPSLSWMLESPGAYFNPQLWLDLTGYDIGQPLPGMNPYQQRVLPIFDIDMGLYILRHFQWGTTSLQQTLQPRLFYLYTPYQNQNDFPNFDTVQLPFFFDQIFALNTYQSFDRLQNANQFGFGLSSKITSTDDSREILSANLGSIYFISPPKICLIAGCPGDQRKLAPIVSNLSLHPTRNWTLSGSLAWDPKLKTTNNSNVTLGYLGDHQHIMNLSYQFVNNDTFALATFAGNQAQPVSTIGLVNDSRHIIFDFAWPLSKQWSTLGYVDYNLSFSPERLRRLNRLDAVYVGLQYNTCCWAVRLMAKQLFIKSTINPAGNLVNHYDTGLFVTFTLKGGTGNFSTGTNNRVKTLVPGYEP